MIYPSALLTMVLGSFHTPLRYDFRSNVIRPYFVTLLAFSYALFHSHLGNYKMCNVLVSQCCVYLNILVLNKLRSLKVLYSGLIKSIFI